MQFDLHPEGREGASSRAPHRVIGHGGVAQMWLPRVGLSSCVRALVSRSTLGVGRDWPPHWHLNHFPASPLCVLGWFLEGHCDLVLADGQRQRMPSVYLSGPFTHPTCSVNSEEGHGLMLFLLPDALQALTGRKPADLINQLVPADSVLSPDWMAMSAQVIDAPDDATRVALIESFLEPLWQACRPEAGGLLRASGRDWAQALWLRAAQSGPGRSLRAAERRIKGWTGLPMRELRGLGRAEQALFRARVATPEAPAWSELALDAGYADQSHLCRETRRITGFAPADLRRRIAEDESFWIYRIWS
jgi:AraC-like DNA-binding protein